MTKNEAEDKAVEVNEVSLNYHLSHATFACEKIIQNEMRKSISKRSNEIKVELDKAIFNNDDQSQKALMAEAERLMLYDRYRIFIDYISTFPEDRAVVTRQDNHLIINLPEKILTGMFNSDGTYNNNIVKKIRRIMAHELGHIALHTKEIIASRSIRGDMELRDKQSEVEVDWFADMLLKLRHDRNVNIYRNYSKDSAY